MAINEAPDYLVNTIFSSLGIGDFEEIRNYIKSRAIKLIWNNKSDLITAFLKEKVEDGTLLEVKVEGIERMQFIKSADSKKLEGIKPLELSHAKLVNPFDNVVRDRKLLQKFWNYNYKLEAYTPAAKQIFGYYLMPILVNHQFIGRLEPKAHRKEAILEIKSIYFENWFKPNNKFYEKLTNGLKKFASFHNCEKITLNDNIPNNIKNSLSTVLQ